MALTDARGEPTSSSNRNSLEAYETAQWQLLAYTGDPVATIDAALAEDPDFVMGHILRAHAHLLAWEPAVLPEIEGGLAQAEALSDAADDRELAHMAALRCWLCGDWRKASALLDRILVVHRRDALALQVGHISDFMHGERHNLRDRVARALPAWSPDTPGYGFVLGMHAFGLEECADYGRAEETGREALAYEPLDGWAHHAVAHVMEMQGRQADGIDWMMTRRAEWATPDNGFAFHNWWHLALYHLDLDQVDRALQLYDQAIHPRPSELRLELLDATALLWRLYLRGGDVGERWHEVADSWAAGGDDGFLAFNDMHAMMAYAATGRRDAAAALVDAVIAATQGTGTNAAMAREVGLPIVRAIDAFGRGRYGHAVDLLLPVRYRAHRFGGSHAQRDVLAQTLIEAALRDGQFALARALITERTMLKPHCPPSWRQAAQAARALGDLHAAETAEAQAAA